MRNKDENTSGPTLPAHTYVCLCGEEDDVASQYLSYAEDEVSIPADAFRVGIYELAKSGKPKRSFTVE